MSASPETPPKKAYSSHYADLKLQNTPLMQFQKFHQNNPSPASTFANTISTKSFPPTPNEAGQNSVDVSDAYLKASMSDAKILDDHDDKYEFKWLDARNKEHEGKAFSKNLFESKFASSSDEFTASELFSPPETRNRYRNIVESPSWRREKKGSLRSFSNDVPDPFVSEKRDVSHGLKSLSISSPPEASEPSKNLFHPREDRVGLQLSADTAQAMLPPNACVFVANLSQARTDEQLEYSVTSVFQVFGDVYVKVRRDSKGMPFAFCQYENASDAQRAIILGRGVPVDGRPCRTEVAKVNRELSWENKQLTIEKLIKSPGSLYLSKVTGGTISESEAHQALSRFGALEKVWYCSQTEREMFRLPEGIWIMFAFFQDCRDAQAGFRDDVTYRLEQPRIPDDVSNKFGNRSFQPLPILRSKSTIKVPPSKLSNQRVIDLCSIFVGNVPLQAREQSLKKIFGTFGRICRVELIKKPAPYQNQMIAFAFIEYSTAEEAASATQGVFMLLGSRLRVQQKENLYLNPNRFGHAFTHTRPMANRFNPNDEAISMVFQRGVSVGMAKATNFQGAGVAQSGIPPPAIQYPLNSQFFGRQNPPLSQGTYAQYPFYPSPPPNLPAGAMTFGPSMPDYQTEIPTGIRMPDGSYLNPPMHDFHYPPTAAQYLHQAHISSRNPTYQWPVANSAPDPNDLAFMNSDKLR